MEKIITCINCPVGCRMTVTLSDSGDFTSVTGNTCPRGEKYARQECTAPERMITAVIPVPGRTLPLSVKTASPIPKAMIRQIMDALSQVAPQPPIALGQVIVPNVLDTGVDIIATRNVP